MSALGVENMERRRWLVLGLGRTGMAVCRHLLDAGHRVWASDIKPRREWAGALQALEARGLEWLEWPQVVSRLEDFDQVIPSPGIPLDRPPLAQALEAGITVTSEIDLAPATIARRSVAITGSNGKSTVTALAAAMLGQGRGRNAVACGNFGTPLVEATAADAPGRHYAVELSSFQLETTTAARFGAVVLLNIQPDHLDRHGSFEAYAAAKWRIASLRLAGAPLVACVDDPAVAAGLAGVAPPVLAIRSGAPEGPGGGVESGRLVLDLGDGREELGPVATLPLPGPHNVLNILAAATACRAMGVPLAAIRQALDGFSALPHRLEPVAVRDDVLFVDDSKATNVAAALEAARAFPDRRVLILLGGRDKAGDFRPLAEVLSETGAIALTFGEAGETIARTLGQGGCRVERCDTLEDATRRAAAAARPGDVVLLSPACASFDAFNGFAHRGEVFADLARRLGGGA
ncbi:MAG: UDP-N-acetylmuramoyl-L-alanine--D-glutamate ligase [Acidobacteriota bacterium]|nr:UDP-N-acetylmuramoyl-L-alanine--D-glutamate ligase [Acidobacteriota bacterium]MDQ7087925.1 UDP-N-acetylmuramoyl-L-alanine--D-glutamate ligase [Acidobacteriota bacterium]